VTLNLKLNVLAASILVFSGVAYADPQDNAFNKFGDNVHSPAGGHQTHVYCPRGASLYWGIFGYWCEDGVYAGVHPMDCKSGPGQAVGSWNDSSLSADQICTKQSTSMVASQGKIPD